MMRLHACLLVLGSAALASDSLAQCQVAVTAPDLVAGDRFGEALSASGTTFVVGSPGDDDAGMNSGSVNVFELQTNGWTLVQKILAADAAAGDSFGRAVSLSGNTLLVSAPQEDDLGTDAGAVYVFNRIAGVWSQSAKLTGSQATTGDQFGFAVAIEGPLAVISARLDSPFGTNSGSAYVFRRIGGQWQEQAYLTASDGGVADFFGESVAVDGPVVLVGAYGEDDGGTGSGAVYSFAFDGTSWIELQKIEPANGAALDFFGWDVAAEQGRLVVGANGRTTPAGGLAGAVFVFERTGGTYFEVAELQPTQQAMGDSFGFSVALAGDLILVGASLSDVQGMDAGRGYVFELNGTNWVEVHTTNYPGVGPGQRLGREAALAGQITVLTTNTTSGLGAAWIERGPFGDCNGNGVLDGCDVDSGTSLDLDGDRVPDECGSSVVFCVCDMAAPCGNVDSQGGCANSTGQGALLSIQGGSLSAAADDLELGVSGLPPFAFVLLFMGVNETAPVVLGGGLRCVAAPLYRFPLTAGDGAGNANQGPGFVVFSQVSFPAAGMISAGSTFRFQAWYRDAMGPCATSNLTQGLALTFLP